MDIRAIAVTRAIDMLKAAGAQFKIIHGDQEYGDLIAVKPKPVKVVKHRRNFRHTGYLEKVAEMQPGDAHTFECPETDPAAYRAFCSSVSAQAVTRWGKGNAITARQDGCKIQVLRVA